MSRSVRVIHWAPRVLGILQILFISLFAFDVFDLGLGFWQTMGALLMHLIPSFVVLAILVLGWWRPLLGAIGFAGVFVFFLVKFFNPSDDWGFYVLISPFVICALLFFLDWRLQQKDQGVS